NGARTALDALKKRVLVLEIPLVNDVDSGEGFTRSPQCLVVERVVVGSKDNDRPIPFVGADRAGHSQNAGLAALNQAVNETIGLFFAAPQRCDPLCGDLCG